MPVAEKLGAFYLGKDFDLAAGTLGETPLMYDARDLTTHAVCVGMTGSGKTGLCIDLLEEAALDKVPAIIIDPKGDITNLLLTFPDLRGEDFLPWINADDARRKDMTPEAFAEKTANDWRNGLESWDQGPERIRALKESADFVIYTPGSDAGVPVSIVSSLAAPELNWDDNQEALREQISGTVSALLGLVGIAADPMRSREHILLATIFEYYWRKGQDLDLPKLILSIQNPPVRQLGVFDVDTFFPQKDRFALAITLNNMIASPAFGAWIQGVPLNIDHMLYGGDAKPNMSIFYIAHLSDAERMFFVTLLLEQVITWMRAQPGTTSLRALVYMDEVFGFFPPVGEPPSKRPLLTLMKQARAFGVGMMLTTQNPVDLDYKGLTNAGTWFIGKLQAERDKARVLEGLETVSATAGSGFNRSQLDKIIPSLGSRVFLMHNINEDSPVIFQTRWAMSYLRGPLTRSQVKTLMASQPAATQPAEEVSQPAAPPAPGIASYAATTSAVAPALPPDLPQVYLPATRSMVDAVGALEKEQGTRLNVTDKKIRYEAQILGTGTVHFVDDKRNVNQRQAVVLAVEPPGGSGLVRWDQAVQLDLDLSALDGQPEADAIFGDVPDSINSARELSALSKDLSDYLYRNWTYPLLFNPALAAYGEPGEDERAFKIRCQQLAREQRDAEVDKLGDAYEKKIDALEAKLRREEQELADDQATYDARKQQEMVSAGDTILSLFGGRRRRAGTILSSASKKRELTARAKRDVEESQDQIAAYQQDINDLEKELKDATAEITQRWQTTVDNIETYEVKPRRTDVDVDQVVLAWTPFWQVTVSEPGGESRVELLSGV